MDDKVTVNLGGVTFFGVVKAVLEDRSNGLMTNISVADNREFLHRDDVYGTFNNVEIVEDNIATPGIDPRQWVSVGHVDSDDFYSFDPDLGPLISVTLQPSGEPAQCRVAMQVSGDGEGDYHPFVEGDAVAVALLGGSIRDCIIFARLSSKRAPFPSSSIAGQDPTKNVIGFTRRRTPYVQENAGPLMLREARVMRSAPRCAQG